MNILEEQADYIQALLSLIQRNHWSREDAIAGIGMSLGVVLSRGGDHLTLKDLERGKESLWTVIQAGFLYGKEIPRTEPWLSLEAVQALTNPESKH